MRSVTQKRRDTSTKHPPLTPTFENVTQYTKIQKDGKKCYITKDIDGYQATHNNIMVHIKASSPLMKAK